MVEGAGEEAPGELELEALAERAAAARRLIAAGELDPALGLSYVVWPPARVEDRQLAGQARMLVELAIAPARGYHGEARPERVDSP